MILLEIPNTFAENNQKMSESTFQIKTRVNAVNIPISEMDAINAKIIVLSEKTGRSFATIKDLFTFMLDYSLEDKEVVNTQNDNSDLVKEISNLNTELAGLKRNITELDIEISEKDETINSLYDKLQNQPTPLPEKDGLVVFEVTEDEATVLKGIAENRLKKGYEDELHDISAMAKKMIFNRPTLINMSGGFYTGV